MLFRSVSQSRYRSTSYLNPAKLFALVDLDIQSQTLTTDQAYQPYNTFQEIEEIFRKLYNQGKFQGLDDYKNHVLVTGLIHKEAYFLLPELQSLLTEYEARYNDSELNLDTLYPEIGIRKALGANQKTIRNQFLVESIVICLMGGVFGIL